MTDIRTCHFERLNSYRQSAEYGQYAKEIGADVPPGDLPSLIGKRWEIDEQIYHEFLEILPPLGWRNGSFYLSEFTFGDITTKYTKDGDKYYCEFTRFPERKPAIETPWGPPDTIKQIADGIMFYSTPSHGGYCLSPERLQAMPEHLRACSFTRDKWFEEDCSWCAVALAFPECFPPDALDAARRTYDAAYKGKRAGVHAVAAKANAQLSPDSSAEWPGKTTPLATLDRIAHRLADSPPIDLIAKLMPLTRSDAINWVRRLPHWDEYRSQHTDQTIALARVISRRAMREFGLQITDDGRVDERLPQAPRSNQTPEMTFPLVIAGQKVQVRYTPSYFPLIARDDFSFTAESNPLSESGQWHQFVDHDAVEAVGGPEAFAALYAHAKVAGRANEFMAQFEGRSADENRRGRSKLEPAATQGQLF